MNKNNLYESLMLNISKQVKKHLSESFFDDMFDKTDNTEDNSLLGDISVEDNTSNLLVKSLQKIDNQVPLLVAYSQQTHYNKVPRGFKHIIPEQTNEPQYFKYICQTTSNVSGRQCAYDLKDSYYHDKWTLYDNTKSGFIPYAPDFGYPRLKQTYVINAKQLLLPVDCNMNTTLSDIEDEYKKYGCELYFELNKEIISTILQNYKKYVNSISNKYIKELFAKSNLYEYCLVSPDGGLMLTKKMVVKYNKKHQSKEYIDNTSKFIIAIHNNNQEYIYLDLYFEYRITFTGAIMYDDLVLYKTPQLMKRDKLRKSLDIIEDYDDDSFVVFGYTYKIKEDIKKLGGKFSNDYINSKGKRESGWKIPKTNREEFDKIFE